MPLDIANFGRPADHPLKQPVLDMIWHKYRNTERHLQVELGPSEIGEECTRRLAYNITHHRAINAGGDPLPSIVGTAAHTWLEAACREWNDHVGRVDWIAEATLNIAAGITGHCDAYYVPTGDVIDWKFPGQEPLRKVKKDGHPSLLYQRQAHLYGKAWTQFGLPVHHVAVVFFPRGGLLSGAYFWSTPFDMAIADAALTRYWHITQLTEALNVTEHPENYRHFDTAPSHACTYCSWFQPGEDTGHGCPGYTT